MKICRVDGLHLIRARRIVHLLSVLGFLSLWLLNVSCIELVPFLFSLLLVEVKHHDTRAVAGTFLLQIVAQLV